MTTPSPLSLGPTRVTFSLPGESLARSEATEVLICRLSLKRGSSKGRKTRLWCIGGTRFMPSTRRRWAKSKMRYTVAWPLGGTTGMLIVCMCVEHRSPAITPKPSRFLYQGGATFMCSIGLLHWKMTFKYHLLETAPAVSLFSGIMLFLLKDQAKVSCAVALVYRTEFVLPISILEKTTTDHTTLNSAPSQHVGFVKRLTVDISEAITAHRVPFLSVFGRSISYRSLFFSRAELKLEPQSTSGSGTQRNGTTQMA